MKWTIIAYFFCLAACGQKQKTGFANPEVFNAKYVKLVPDTNRMMLIENVVIEFGDLRTEADSALLNKPQQTVTVYGIKKASFKGEDLKIPSGQSLHYKKGDLQPRLGQN